MSKAEKIIVKLIEKNQQLEEDAERYQKLFLEMEQKVWNLEDELKELRGLWPLDDEEPLSMTDEEVRRRLAEPIAELEDDDLETLIPEQDCGD